MGRASAALLLGLLLPAAADAQMYKCVNGRGQVQFSQVKPRDGACAQIDEKSPGSLGNSGTDLKSLSKSIDESRSAEAEQRQGIAQQRSERAKRCENARQRQAILDHYGSRIAHFNEKGEKEYMSEERYQQERRSAERDLRESCG